MGKMTKKIIALDHSIGHDTPYATNLPCEEHSFLPLGSRKSSTPVESEGALCEQMDGNILTPIFSLIFMFINKWDRELLKRYSYLDNNFGNLKIWFGVGVEGAPF